MTPQSPLLPQKASHHRKDDGNEWSGQPHWKNITQQYKPDKGKTSQGIWSACLDCQLIEIEVGAG